MNDAGAKAVPENYDDHLSRAIDAVIQAARVTRAVQQQIDLASLEKGDKSPVTAADFASQAVVCRSLGDAIPLVGEEDASDLRGPESAFLDRVVGHVRDLGIDADGDAVCNWIDQGGHDGSGDLYWTLDPIDGTKGFLRKEQYAISLALIEKGEIVVGVLGCPNLPTEGMDGEQIGTLQFATKGGGALQAPLDNPDNRVAIAASDLAKTSGIRLCESVESGHSSHSHSARIATRLGIEADPVRLDSQAKYATVARGDADAYLRLPTRPGYQEKIWDHAGGVLVTTEAGGRVSDVDGKPLDFSRGSTLADNRGVVATAAGVHDDVLAAVAAVLVEDAEPAA